VSVELGFSRIVEGYFQVTDILKVTEPLQPCGTTPSFLEPTEPMWHSAYIGLSKFKSRDANSPVTSVSFCAYANEGNEGDEHGRPATNRWAVFLEISETKSVKLDMIPGDGSDGLTGMLVIESKSYLYTNKAIFTPSFPTRGEPTVDNLVSSLLENGMDRYKFTEAQEGCR